jgi:hypothetical protein
METVLSARRRSRNRRWWVRATTTFDAPSSSPADSRRARPRRRVVEHRGGLLKPQRDSVRSSFPLLVWVDRSERAEIPATTNVEQRARCLFRSEAH